MTTAPLMTPETDRQVEAIKTCYRGLRDPVELLLQGTATDENLIQRAKALGQANAYLDVLGALLPERTREQILDAVRRRLSRDGRL